MERDEEVEIYLKKRLIGRGRCQIKTTGDREDRLQYIQWLGGFVPPFPYLERPCTLVFDDGARIEEIFDDVSSGAGPSDWLHFTAQVST